MTPRELSQALRAIPPGTVATIAGLDVRREPGYVRDFPYVIGGRSWSLGRAMEILAHA